MDHKVFAADGFKEKIEVTSIQTKRLRTCSWAENEIVCRNGARDAPNSAFNRFVLQQQTRLTVTYQVGDNETALRHDTSERCSIII